MTASAQTSTTHEEWDDECDVLVVGSGAGGLTGAYTAAHEGLSVILVEAAERFGGATAYSGGGMWFPGNAALRRAGTQDTLERARTYFHAVVGDRSPVELQDAFLETGAPLVDYLERHPHLEFVAWPWPDYFGSAPCASPGDRHIVARPLEPQELGALRDSMRPPLPTELGIDPLPELLVGGQALIGRLLLAVAGVTRIERRCNTMCDALVRVDERVQGAVVTRDGVRRRIRTRRGVLIASGGFERNQTMRAAHHVPGFARDAMGPISNQGAAIRAGMDVGAATDLMSEAWWAPGVTHPSGRSSFSLWFTGGILVDDAGDRFVNESAAYDRIGRTVIDRMADGSLTLPYWMIYDDRNGVRPPIRSVGVPISDTADYERAGLWFTADTLDELAVRIGVPADRLVATVDRFNDFARTDDDADFHRGDEPYDRWFVDGDSPLVPLEQAPFHAAAFGLSDLGTKGGLCTDASARVLDHDGAVISGLYAAGNSMAAASGDVYPGGGNPIGACMVFSHLAALDMARSVV